MQLTFIQTLTKDSKNTATMEGKLVLTTAALAAFALFAPACSQGDRNVIQWIDGVGSSPGELGVLPAGYESHVIHSCRVRVGNDVAAGKLYYTTNCEYVYNGGHAQSGNYEVTSTLLF